MTKILLAIGFGLMISIGPVRANRSTWGVGQESQVQSGSGLLCEAHAGREDAGFVYEYQEPGNPEHKEPTEICTHHPVVGKKGVACTCHQSCTTTENDSTCKSYCFKKWCNCMKEDCD